MIGMVAVMSAAAAGGTVTSASASAHRSRYGGRAKTYAIGTPTDSGAHRCGHGVYSGPRTGCALARKLFSVFARGEHRLHHPPGWVRVARARHRTKRFTCEVAGNDHFVVCQTRSGALVDFAVRDARARSRDSAVIARSCGRLNGHGLSVPLPIRAWRVSCARARRLAAAWNRRAGKGRRGSACIPADGGAPHKTCRVRHWRCTARHSRDGSTIPVACARGRKRVRFKAPV